MEQQDTVLKDRIEEIADQLCLAVKGEFDFTININAEDQSIQKLTMLINFVLDAARRSIVEVKEKNDKLTELDRLKSDFMANISHELRTPLTLILGPLEMILKNKSFELPADVDENLKRMQRNAIRLYMLVNNVLDFSKLEVGKFEIHEEPLDLNQVISELVDDAKGLAHERNLTLEYFADKAIGNLLFDHKIIEKIILNLISNALKFTPEGGKVTLSLQHQNHEICISIKDTGVGIPATQISSIFERFHQVDSSSTRAHEGTGIGLSLIRQFVELMHGKITVASEEGKGTQFTITLPARIPQQSDKISEPHEIHAVKVKLSSLATEEKTNAKLTNEKDSNLPLILIVDDNHDIQAYISSLLKNSYQIITADNGKLALEMVTLHHPQVILSDVMMPEMDGYQLTTALKADPMTHDIPIILITAKMSSDAVTDSLAIGADDYLSKPFSPEELIARTDSAYRHYRQHLNNCELNNQLVTVARRAGMADISTSVLHNVGNILNSVKVSVGILQENISKPHTNNLLKITALIKDNLNNLAEYFTHDAKGKVLPEYLLALTTEVNNEFLKSAQEIQHLIEQVKYIEDIVAMQQALSGASGIAEKLFLPEVINTAITMCRSSIEKRDIELEKDIKDELFLTTDKSKLLQIIVNLIQNANDALSIMDHEIPSKKIAIKVAKNLAGSDVDIIVHDNGVGIQSENLNKIFNFGFTTKPQGHGFGLHSSALAAKELGGSLQAKSDGAGLGSQFILTLPLICPTGRFLNEPKHERY